MDTQVNKKIINFLEDLVRREAFIKDIKDIRIKYGIPETGFSVDDFKLDEDIPKFLRSGDDFSDSKLLNDLDKEVSKLEKTYFENKISLKPLVVQHIFYGNLIMLINKYNFPELGLIRYFDLDMFVKVDGKSIKIRDLLSKVPFFEDIDSFKKMMLINEEVSGRDVKDFIDKNYKAEKELTLKFNLKKKFKEIFKNRERKDLGMVDLIYKNKHEDIETISSILKENNIKEILGYSEIRDIINKEKKRRNK